MAESDGAITFTAKELIVQANDKLDRVIEILGGKVDRSEFAALLARVSDIELHGSHQAGEALTQASKLEARIESIERTNLQNEQYIPRFIAVEEQVKTNTETIRVLGSGISTQIRDALERTSKVASQARDRTLSNAQKWVVIVTASIAAIGTLISLWIGFKTHTF